MKKLLYLSLLFLLSGCTTNTSFTNTKIDNLDTKYDIKLKDFFSQKEDNYYVYFYSNTCTTCEEIRPYLNAYLDKEERSAIYLLNTNKTTEDRWRDDPSVIENSIGVSDVSNLYFYQTPVLYKIVDHTINNVETNPYQIRIVFEN